MTYYIRYRFCVGCWHTEPASDNYDEAVAKAESKVSEGFDEVSVRYRGADGTLAIENIQ